ncbi:hypothetical protein [Pyrodictium delaneyi]|uniref:Uncharacterized protein n=1 Tax=Pyrodictium delaneyi TaxID=1273541 RepID=A0A211YRB9_9CREN|nr:hypothetical protein [Pyrodictium delaneyi]OWJ55582.1 hypothetical protein Pdsh_02000 [Pyrodictium delaneyi]
MRALSEIVGAVALAVIASVFGALLVSYLAPRVELLQHTDDVDAFQSIRVNSTHAVCYAFTSIDVDELREMGVSVWLFNDTNGDGWNETVPVFNGTIPPGQYYVVSPPVCG